jgi:DNA polymerase III alpha subunit
MLLGGVFDGFGDRKDLLNQLVDLSNAKSGRKKRKRFSFTDEQILIEYHKSMGFFEKKIKTLRKFSKSVIDETEFRDYPPNEYVVVGGVITAKKEHKTKVGEKMMFLTIQDLDESFDITLFPKTLAEFKDSINIGAIVQISGRKSDYGGKQNSMVADILEFL